MGFGAQGWTDYLNYLKPVFGSRENHSKGRAITFDIFGVNREDLLPSSRQTLTGSRSVSLFCTQRACSDEEFSCSDDGQLWFGTEN